MDYYHLHARRTVQDAPFDRFVVGLVPTLGHHIEKALRNKTGTHDWTWKRGNSTSGLGKTVLEVGRRRERPTIVFRAGGEAVQTTEHQFVSGGSHPAIYGEVV